MWAPCCASEEIDILAMRVELERARLFDKTIPDQQLREATTAIATKDGQSYMSAPIVVLWEQNIYPLTRAVRECSRYSSPVRHICLNGT